MSAHTLPGADPPDSDLMNYAVRMVIPLRREFGTSLDVPHFLHDFTYARGILDQAKASRDPRLREYAGYLENKLLGPRNGPPPAAPRAAPAQSPAVVHTRAEVQAGEDELRRKMMAKYKGGLR